MRPSSLFRARLWARRDIARLLETDPAPESPPPTYREIRAFYAPLAVTPFINLAAHPMITFFLGRGQMPLESLAVMPVLNAFGFIFRCQSSRLNQSDTDCPRFSLPTRTDVCPPARCT